jgi:hypothetical protein
MMKRLLLIVVACLSFGHGAGEARQSGEARQYGPPYSSFAETGQLLCQGWNRAPLGADGRFSTSAYLGEGTKHAWVYGFVVGASYASETRLLRIDAPTASAWMERYCGEHPRARLADAAADLIDELSRP